MKKVFTALCLLFSLNAISQTTYFVNDNASGANNGSSWMNAFTKLQDALAAAGSGEQIWVAAGIYYPDEGVGLTNDNRTHSFHLKNGVAIYGGFAGTEIQLSDRNVSIHITTLSGDIDQDNTPTNNALHVVQSSSVDNTTVLDGFTITGGNANGNSFQDVAGGGIYNTSSSPTLANCSFSGNTANNYGGGIFNTSSSSPILTNCNFSGNTSSQGGGGIYNLSSSPTLTNCSFSGNMALVIGGGMCNLSSSPTLTKCSFSGNSAEGLGGGIYNDGSSPTLTNCIFTENYSLKRFGAGGGIFSERSAPTFINCNFSENKAEYGGGMCNVSSSPILTNCRFSENTATYGGGGIFNDDSYSILTNCNFTGNTAVSVGGGIINHNFSNPTQTNSTLTNCRFSGNMAENGGGIYNEHASPIFRNCSFSINTAEFGGGMYNYFSFPTLTNCILWGNTGNQIFNEQGSNPMVSYSIVQGGYAGISNLDQDPLFVDAANENLRLQPNSPAIDAGLNSANTTSVDLDGNPRIVNSIIDMGAFEFQGIISSPVVDAGADQTINRGHGSQCVTLIAQASEGTAPYQYTWSPGGASSQNITVCPTSTTTYTVTVSDANGQTASDAVTVNVTDVRCGNKGDKVLVCHKGKTLCIASSAVEAHLKHGDQLGNCAASPSLNSITENKDAYQLIEERPEHFRVSVAPNPFNTSTKLQYVLPADGFLSIKVYDVVGREVAIIAQAEQKTGIYNTDFNSSNLAKGVYYYRAVFTTKQKTYSQLGKMMLIK